jgi:cytochrome c556
MTATLHHRRGAFFALVASLLVAPCAIAAEGDKKPPTDAERAIKYRQSVYKVISWNVAPMAAVVQHKAPYDATEFARRASRVGLLAPMLMEGYTSASSNPEGVATRAKPELWNNMDDFRTLMDAMVQKAQALATMSQGGDEAASVAAFKDLYGACKACHDKYRSE